MTPNQAAEKPLGGFRIPAVLNIHIDHIPVLIDGPQQIAQIASDPDKDLVDVEPVSEPRVLAPQAPSKLRSELDAPEADRFVADRNPPFRQQAFYISMAQRKSMIQPDGMADDVGWETVALVDVWSIR